jgi:hypothetical protein
MRVRMRRDFVVGIFELSILKNIFVGSEEI